METNYLKQLDFYDPSNNKAKVLVAGVGSVGSFTVYALAKMGVKDITIVDPDVVESTNLNVQVYGMNCSEQSRKVDALSEFVLKTCGIYLRKYPVRINSEVAYIPRTFYDVFILAADEKGLGKWVIDNIDFDFLLAGTTGGEYSNLFSFPKSDKESIDYWLNILTMEIEPRPCTQEGCIDMSFLISSHIVRAFRQWATSNRYNTHLFLDGSTGNSYEVFSSSLSKKTRGE